MDEDIASVQEGAEAPAVVPDHLVKWNHELPIPAHKFTSQLLGTEDEVWVKVFHAQHGHKRHTEREFAVLLHSLKE